MALSIRRLWLGALLATPFCWAQDQLTDVYKIGGGVSAPSLIHKIEPEYPEEARLTRFQGTVVMSLVVAVDGQALDLQVGRSLGLGLDEKATAAVREWTFRPALKDGQPVNVRATVEVNFRLLDKEMEDFTHLSQVQFHTPAGATRPTVQSTVLPIRSNGSKYPRATVTFDINEEGNAANIQVDRTSDDVWASEVIAALRQWKFKPGSKNGVPVSIPCTMDFIRERVF